MMGSTDPIADMDIEPFVIYAEVDIVLKDN
jgi:hypothetical protein